MKLILLLFIFGTPPHVRAISVQSFNAVSSCEKYLNANAAEAIIMKGVFRCVEVENEK